MPSLKMLKTILNEYGISWVMNRTLYSAKVKLLNTLPLAEKIFEVNGKVVKRVDLFPLDADKIANFIKALPVDEKQNLVAQADAACQGKILGFSSIKLDYGTPINWQLNPLTGKSCDITKKWYQIPDFDKNRGDIKVIWEISRFSHFLTLARAYLLSSNKKYYTAFSEQLSDWLKKNPYDFGSNYKCGQECSLRMANVLLTYSVFQKSGVATSQDTENVEKLIDWCYRRVRSNFFYAYKCIKNNHTLSELMGMIIGAWCCVDNEQLAKAYKTLDEVVTEQFFEDGGYRQYSFNYQRLALQDLECILAMEQNTGQSISKLNKERILKSALLLYQCQNEHGDVPNYGSNDGALIFPVTSCSYWDFRPVINTIYALIRGSRLYDTGIYDEELFWFVQNIPVGKANIERISSSFPKAGVYTIRKDKYWLMVILNDYHSRPAHMDQLHIDLWVGGRNILCDAGTYSYASDLGKELLHNDSHNTIVYDYQQQMKTYGPFMVYDWTKSSNIQYKTSSFVGKMESKNGYIHYRDIRAQDAKLTIVDTIIGIPGKEFEIHFHTPFVFKENNESVEICNDNVSICELSSELPFYIKKSKRSLYYLKVEETEYLVFKGKVGAEGSQTVCTNINIF